MFVVHQDYLIDERLQIIRVLEPLTADAIFSKVTQDLRFAFAESRTCDGCSTTHVDDWCSVLNLCHTRSDVSREILSSLRRSNFDRLHFFRHDEIDVVEQLPFGKMSQVSLVVWQVIVEVVWFLE